MHCTDNSQDQLCGGKLAIVLENVHKFVFLMINYFLIYYKKLIYDIGML